MEQNIKKQLELIEQSNSWIKTSLEGEKQKNAYRNLVNCRRKLNKKKFALEGNPAAAMYGESQAGKSYLVSALLSEEGKPFKILDGKRNEFDFKNQINPRGNEMESTSVITRFSTKYKWIKQDYPVIAKLLTPTDIILVICEAYYNNLKANKSMSYEDLKAKINEFESNFTNRTECQKLIIEDDVLDIEEYFDENFSNIVYNNIKDVNFFEKISSLITKISPDEWKNVFSLLWNFNSQLTKLFDDLIDQYKKLDFADTVYLPIDAVLRDKGTLLDVSRLDEIYDSFKGQEPEYSRDCLVFYTDKDENEKTVKFSKPYLCALTAELIFVLPENIKQEKQFLDKTDLLDFPGTRRFESTNEDNISDKSLTVLLRRGRVDYLFNKYSSTYRINTLLFCQNHKQSNQSVMPEKLNRWIGNMIGKTPSERESFKSEIPPLFVISTWFNKDLEFDYSTDNPEKSQSFNERWDQRFSRTLEKEIFKVDTYTWMNEWTISNPNFQNIYLLRDFEKSGENVLNASNIYRGYNEIEKKETEEIISENFPDFRNKLRQSFIDYYFVKRHFANPSESWDRAASINEDGTKLIIDKLTIAAKNINNARREKTINELNEISAIILNELQKYYHSNDKDEELQKAKSTAGDIQLKLDLAFKADGVKKFGHLLKEFMLDESSVYELYRKEIDNVERRDVINMDKYSTIRMNVPELNANESVETNLEYLYKHYEKATEEQKKQFITELEADGIDLEELIRGNTDRIKNFSQQLAEALIEYWLTYVGQSDKQTIREVFSESSLQDILEMYRKLFQKLRLDKVIAGKIRHYVDGYSKTESAYEMIADISAEILNKCINSVGLEYFTDSDFTDLKSANEINKLGLVLDFDEIKTDENLNGLFEKIDNLQQLLQNNPETIKSLPSFHNYILWRDKLKVGFVSVCDIPNYDVQANEKLGSIIKKHESIRY